MLDGATRPAVATLCGALDALENVAFAADTPSNSTETVPKTSEPARDRDRHRSRRTPNLLKHDVAIASFGPAELRSILGTRDERYPHVNAPRGIHDVAGFVVSCNPWSSR